jgi:hypothetical protein
MKTQTNTTTPTAAVSATSMKDWMLRSELESGAESIDNVIAVLERAKAEVIRHRASYECAVNGESNATPEDVLSWVTNYVASSILGNCRLDMLVTHAARIAAARAAVKFGGE